MSEFTPEKRRDRSPSFPYLSLKEAVEKLRDFHGKYQRHPARVVNVAEVWNFSPGSSSLLRNVAALKSFGLVDYEGSGKDRKIIISELGLTIVADRRPGHREEAIREAFKNCDSLHEHYQTWGAQRPPDTECISQLHIDEKFTEPAARKFLSVYDESLSYAKLDGVEHTTGGEGVSQDDSEHIDVGMYVQWEQNGQLRFAEPRRILGFSSDGAYAFFEGDSTGIPRAELVQSEPPAPGGEGEQLNQNDRPRDQEKEKRELVEATYPLKEGPCTLILPRDISPKSAMRLQKWLQLMLDDVRDIAGTNEYDATSADADQD